MNIQNRKSFRMRAACSFILLLSLVVSLYASQNPSQAESYRRLAAAKRKAAQNVPAKRDCYNAWANYYDCLAIKYETGVNKDCGKEPAPC